MAFDFAKIERIVNANLARFGVPSLSLAVVSGQEVIYQGCFGHKDAESRLAPDPLTRYACASVTKAMTATCLGMLRDEGKIDWDTPVINYIPEFRMYDDYATANVTLRDMLSHNTGLPRHDSAWYDPSLEEDFSTQHYMRMVRYLKPNKAFRTQYEYNNFMFAVAGYVVEKVSGMTWQQFIRQRLFAPLGMESTTCTIGDFKAAPNKALPYKKQGGKTVLTQYLNFDGMAGCGSVCSNITDMAAWLALNINKGEYKGRRLVSQKTMDEIHTPRNTVPPIAGAVLPEMPLGAYGFGWTVQPFRSRLCIQHSGGIDGFSAYATFMPPEKLGIVLFANLEGTPLHFATAAAIYDLLLGLDTPEGYWPDAYEARSKVLQADTAKHNAEVLAMAKADTAPSHPLECYAGAFSHPAYGDFVIKLEGGKLSARYHGMDMALVHSNYDTFYLNYSGDTEEYLLPVAFRADTGGSITQACIPLEASLPEPIIFTRPPC